MILLKDLKDKYKADEVIANQLKIEFGDYTSFEKEFDSIWDNWLMEEIITKSSNGQGHLAGAGPVDYNEGKILYMKIRELKPKNVLEIGHAAGCSSVVMATALEKNGFGKLHTCDKFSNATDPNLIPSFVAAIEVGTILEYGDVDALDLIPTLSDIDFEIVFTDASHEEDFCFPIAKLLYDQYPNALHLYHEWSFSDLSCKEAQSYIAIPNNLKHQQMAEREGFEKAFPISKYDHYGFYGSCGLGIVKKKTTEKTIKVYYRLSNQQAGMHKNKLANATKFHCLSNCIKEFGKENITVIGDCLNYEHLEWLREEGLRLIEVQHQNGSGTFRSAMELAIKENKESDFVYLLEDDFLHLKDSADLIKECLNEYDCYATLYDHPDKYIDREDGGNPQVQEGGEVTRVILTANKHWKITNSTVMSFASRVSRLKHDIENLKKHSENRITDSYSLFTELSSDKGIPVLSCIPGNSTHCESAWLSPLTEWEKIND
tara:strand:+ start:5415 stop:6878 length:1464 start_codon:yes stop_codon:yes gene_type:complete